jgi:hypothetical protein
MLVIEFGKNWDPEAEMFYRLESSIHYEQMLWSLQPINARVSAINKYMLFFN